jgi:hypothetical protein
MTHPPDIERVFSRIKAPPRYQGPSIEISDAPIRHVMPGVGWGAGLLLVGAFLSVALAVWVILMIGTGCLNPFKPLPGW